MLLFFKRLVVVITATLLTHTAFGFALLGPRDTWQVSALGYDPQGDNGDLGGPKNLGEEWRWNLPVITYAFDQSFINFFGTNGIAEVEKAIDAFNREMISLNSLSDEQLRSKPTEQKRIHLTAQALGLLDLKSVTMGLLAEQLGMASATRWNWTLRGRAIFNTTLTNYSVIKRNFDPFTLQPSSYVNGRRFTYEIRQFPAAIFSADFEDAVEIPVDQTDIALAGSEVSSMVGEDLTGFPLRLGEYFSGLTQDDVGGLRYIYRSRNVNLEPLPIPTTDVVALSPAIRVVDTNNPVFIQGIDAFFFLSNAAFTNPSNLVAQFPGLEILSTNVTLTNIISTNFVITNIISPTGLFTNTSALTLITNQDLFTFSEASRTNNGNALRALYPGLVIIGTNSVPVEEISTIFRLTNSPFNSIGDPPILVTDIVTNIVANYFYQYANVITNYASATTRLEIQNIGRAPWSTPTDFFLITNKTPFTVNVPSGGFYILDRSTNANLLAYAFSNQFNVPLLRATNILASTNAIFFFTNQFTGAIFRLDEVNIFTNVVYAAYPILFNTPVAQQFVQVRSTNTVLRYNYTFNNLTFIDAGHTNTDVTLITTVLTNGQPIRIIRNVIGTDPGSFVIIDPNLFELAPFNLYPPIRTVTLVTNTILSFTNAATGEFITQEIVYLSNSVRVAVFPVTFVQQTTPILRPGVDTLQFKPQRYFDFYNQAAAFSTNFYDIIAITNNTQFPQRVRRIAGPDILFAAGDLGLDTGAFPVAYARNINFQAGNALVTQFDGGPGLIVGGVVITFSTLAPSFINQTPGTLSEENAFLWLSWGSFDGETLTPRIYPEDITGQITTLQQLEAYALSRNPLPPR